MGVFQLAPNAPRAARMELDVVLGMIADLVACVRDPAGEVGVPSHMRPDEEERCRYVLAS